MRLLKLITMGVAGLTLSAGASALLITDVGIYDTLRGSTNITSGDATEKAWIESVLLTTVTYSKLDETISAGTNWSRVTGTGAVVGDYAFDFGAGTTPNYFLVKVGGGAGTNNSHFLFENNTADRYAFLNLRVFGAGVLLNNVEVISHMATADGVNVPEPATLALLGLGLAGLGLSRRRREKTLKA
jgi:hypothetical protein